MLLIYLAFGDRGLRRVLPTDPEVVAGLGLLVALIAGALGLVLDGMFLSAVAATGELPLVGRVKLTTVLVFDAGVYLVVVGLVGTAIRRLGGEARS